MADVIWMDQAVEEINDIADSIAKDSIKYAIILVSIFFERVIILVRYPMTCRIAPKMDMTDIRELIQC